jgi:alpha-glucosidase
MSLPSWKRMVDFASANNIHSLVLDADWYGPEFNKESDPVKGGKVEQVHQLIAYGKEKGVGTWLYLNDVGGVAYPLEQTLKLYGSWGAVGVKYGFMKGGLEAKNARTQLITKLCAQNHLMVDFHDNPVHPYGQMRTWPNALTREYCHAQLDAHRVFQPKTFVTSVFVNMLAGPIDMNNGVVDMMQRGRVDNPMAVPSTITAEAARTLITFSGATIIPDIPENYNRHPLLLKFISAQKIPWQESKTLSGEIGEYIVMARKAADGNWLIGAATNETARTLDIPLSILDKGNYEALIIQDGKDADYRTNKESYTTETRNVTRAQKIRVILAPGGGACILIKKKE